MKMSKEVFEKWCEDWCVCVSPPPTIEAYTHTQRNDTNRFLTLFKEKSRL